MSARMMKSGRKWLAGSSRGGYNYGIMPEDVTVLKIFAASPGDVAQERASLERIVKKLNLAVAPMLGLRVELIRWETHAYPDFGADAQDVINRQTPDDVDLFIGILWGRFGTPTARAESGTEEEFNRALERYRRGERVKLLIYFKDEALPPSQIDPRQLALVHDFKHRVEGQGGLHWSFVNSFEELVELHLTRHLQEFRRASSMPIVAKESTNLIEGRLVADREIEEPGVLDYMEEYNDHFARLTEVQRRIVQAIEDLGNRMTDRAAEVNRANDEGRRGDLPYIRRLAEKAAEDMAEFVARMEVDVPIFASEFEAGFGAFTRGVAASRDFSTEHSSDDTKEALETLSTFSGSLAGAREGVSGLRSSVAALPRITTVLNRAKRRTVAVLDQLLTEFDRAAGLLVEVDATLRGADAPS